MPAEELRPEDVLLEDEPPEVLPLPPAELLLPEAVDLLPLEELEPVEPALPDVALLSVGIEPLEVEPPEVLPDEDEVPKEVLLPDDVKDFDPLLELVPLVPDSLLVLFSLGVPPVERLVPALLLEEDERALDVVERPTALEAAERPLAFEPPERPLVLELLVRPLELPERPLVPELPERSLEELLWLDAFVDCD